MKTFNFALGLLLAPLLHLSAQVSVEVTLDQEQFLPGEKLTAAVKIRNHSGQTLHLGGQADWLTFSVESLDEFVVSQIGPPPVLGEFELGSSMVATRRVDLAPYFGLTQPGRYSIVATVRIQEWNGQISSDPKRFSIIAGSKLWTQDFGVPMRPGDTNRAPEVRRYTLQQGNDPKKRMRLYLRLTDESEARLIKMVLVGPMVGFSRPEPQLDQTTNLHLLYQDGAHTFSYVVINPDGDLIVRQTYDYVGARPRLQADKDGKLAVVGGVRRPTVSDLPAPKKTEDEVEAPKS